MEADPARVDLRPFSVDDYDAVLALWQETEGIGLSRADDRAAIARYLARNPGMSFTARDASGRLAGAVLCGHDGRRGFIHHLAIARPFRGQGIGKALVERCLEALRGEGIDKCHLFVYDANQDGRAFWLRTGWYQRPELVLMSRDL